MRVKSKWHKTQTKTLDDIAGALAFNTWRICKNQLEDLVNEDFEIRKSQVFDVIVEYLCFLIQSIDRLVYDKLDAEQRRLLVIELVKRCAMYYQENKSERIGEGEHWQAFVAIYNQRAPDYAAYQFINHEPDYHFLRYFGKRIQKSLGAIDEKWIVQQMVEIQAPKAFKAIAKSVNELISIEKIVAKPAAKRQSIPRSKRKSTRPDLQ